MCGNCFSSRKCDWLCHNVAVPRCVAFFRDEVWKKELIKKKAPQLRLDECHLIKGNTSCVREIVFTEIVKVWEVLHCCQSHALRILTCLSDLNLSALWTNKIMKMYCSTNVGLEFEGDICDVTHPVILSGCTVQTGTMHNNWFFKDKVCFRQG